MKFYGHHRHFKFYESFRADLSSKTKKIGFLMFLCMPLALASLKERKQRLIIVHVWNIIFSDFLFFAFFMLDTRCQVQEKCMGSQRYVLIREHH